MKKQFIQIHSYRQIDRLNLKVVFIHIIYLNSQIEMTFNSDPNPDHFLSQAALLACGFEQATCSSIPKQIWNIHPHGGTAMRDAIIYGNNLMMKLHQLLQADQTADSWAFLHIIITDGHDTDSVCSFKRTSHMLTTLRNDLNIRDLKIIILGVEIEEAYAKSIRKLVGVAGIHGEYHDINHTGLHEMFHRIREDAGMHNRTPSLDNADSQPQAENYAVLFTLDISGSMQGKKWDVTRHATVDFIHHLESKDVVSAIIFNETPHLVMHWATRQNQARLKKLQAKLPFEEIMKNEGYFDPEQFKGNKKIVKKQREIADPMMNIASLPQPGRKYILDASNPHRGNRKTGCFCCF